MSESSDLLKNAIVVITGARGVGKSLLALTYYPPKQKLLDRVFVHDSERSSNRFIQELESLGLKLPGYRDLSARFQDLPSSDDLLNRINKGDMPWLTGEEKGALRTYYEHVVSDLNDNLRPGQYDVYVHDTIEKLEGGMVAWVEDNIRMFGYATVKQSMQYAHFWNDAVYSLYEGLISAVFGRGVKVIILTSHLKTPWQDKQPIPGKVAPGGKPLLYKLSSLMIWLVNDDEHNYDGAPAGLVLKERMAKMEIDDDWTWRPRRMIPQRIPHCTWTDIKRYLREGCDLSNPAPGERMSKGEKEMISELLTSEQMRLMILSAEERAANGSYETETPESNSVQFNLPTPEYNRAKAKAVELQGQGMEVTESVLVKVFPPPMQGSRVVKEAVARVLEESSS